MPSMVTDIFNSFFSAIDNVLYYLIQILVYIFDYIAKIHIFDGTLEPFYDRIFYFVSIVMVFKVSFSIIQYIINPDQFSNGEKGFGKVIQGVIIALVGLVVVKPVFQIAVEIEDKIVDENIIPTLVLGIASGDDSSISVDAQNVQSQIPFYLAQAFVVPKAKYGDLSNITETVLYDGAYEKVGYVYEQAVKTKDYSALLSLVNAKYNVGEDGAGNSDEYVFEYRPVVSTACAVFVIIMYLNFCIDLAIRTVKFGFLQIIAPIPIISMVDPKSVKSGMMSKWLKNCFSTYAGLFVRIVAVSFVIFGIRYLIDNEIGSNMENETGIFMNIVIIFGLLMFAKDLPKLITDITGIDLKGDFKINPLKRVSENPVMKPIGALGAAGLAGAAAFGSNALTGITNNKGAGKLLAIPSALAGAASATGRGIVGAVKGEKIGKNFSNSYNAAMLNKKSRDDRRSDGVSWLEMNTSKIQQNLGMHTKGDVVDAVTSKLDSINKAYQSMEGAAIGNDTGKFTATIAGQVYRFDGIKDLQSNLDVVKNTQIDRANYSSDQAYLNAVAQQQQTIKDFDDAKKARLDDIAQGRKSTGDIATDRAIIGSYRQMVDLANEVNKITPTIDSNIGKVNNTSTVAVLNGTAKGVTAQMAGSSFARHAKTVDQYGAKKNQK